MCLSLFTFNSPKINLVSLLIGNTFKLNLLLFQQAAEEKDEETAAARTGKKGRQESACMYLKRQCLQSTRKLLSREQISKRTDSPMQE